MKKFIITLILALVASLTFTAFAQVTYEKPTGKIYEYFGTGYATDLVLEHRIPSESYYLKVLADESSVDSSFFIFLGNGKTEALASLNAIKQMIMDSESGGFVRLDKKTWYATTIGNVKAIHIVQEYNISGNWIMLNELESLIRGFTSNTLKSWS